ALTRHRFRAQDHEIRGRADAPAWVPRRALEVDAARIGGAGRVQRELDGADQLLVAAHRSEWSPVEHVLARLDGEAADGRRGRSRDHRYQAGQAQQHRGPTARHHNNVEGSDSVRVTPAPALAARPPRPRAGSSDPRIWLGPSPDRPPRRSTARIADSTPRPPAKTAGRRPARSLDG